MPQKLRSQLDDLALFPDRMERIDALVALGMEYEASSGESVPRTPETRVPGCESEVYIAAEPDGNSLKYHFGIDNPQGISAMALARILDEGCSGQPLDEITQIPEEIVYDIFGRELSMGKSMGLTGMVRMVKLAAERNLSP